MKTANKFGWLLFAVVMLVAASGFKCGGSSDEGVFKGVMYNDHQLRTPLGATIASKNDINPAFAPLVDGGLSDVFRIAAAPPNNYDLAPYGINHQFYRIWLFPRSPKCETPAFLVDATNSPYEGTEWDKDPSPTRCLVCAAGMTVMQGLPITGAGMVITDDMGIMRTIVRYEAEHSILYLVDGPRYVATQYHVNGQGHPIFGDGPPVNGFSVPSSKFQAVTLKLPGNVVEGDSIVSAKGSTACVLLTK